MQTVASPIRPATRPSGDRGLAARAAAGDPAAQRELVGAHDARLRRMCRSILRNDHDADDAVQEAWTRAMRALPRFSGDDLGAWLSAIARNEAYRIARRRALRPVPMDELPHVADVSSDPFTIAHGHALGSAVAAAVRELSPEYREVAARDIAGQGPAEIAEVVGLTPGATRVRAHRARRRVGEALAAAGWAA